MQTLTFNGHGRDHLSVEVTREGDGYRLRTSDESATVADDEEAASWLASRVHAVMPVVARIIVRETTPGVTIRALAQFGAPVEWADTGKP